jgi:hypothetical protein
MKVYVQLHTPAALTLVKKSCCPKERRENIKIPASAVN